MTIDLTSIKTLTEVSEYYQIPLKTLQSRLKFLNEGKDYKKLGLKQPTILSPSGIKKIKGVIDMRKILDLLVGLNLEEGKNLLSIESKIIKEDTKDSKGEGNGFRDCYFYTSLDDYFSYTIRITEDHEEDEDGSGYWAIMKHGDHITNVGR